MAQDRILHNIGTPVPGKYLGGGAFGFVFEESDGYITRKALKIIVAESIIYTSSSSLIFPEDTEMGIKRYREFDTMVGKFHKNIVTIMSSSEVNYSKGEIRDLLKEIRGTEKVQMFIWRGHRSERIDTLVLRMELCGPTLRKWLDEKSGELGADDLSHFQVEIVQGLTNGLQYLHKNLIMHRDLKPGNIMFSYSSTPLDFKLPIKIGDFGLCRQIHGEESGGESSLTSNIGTLIYQAPETILSNSYTLQADLYSLGLVFWEVLQLLPKNDREKLFNRLVEYSHTYLVVGHLDIFNSKSVIVGLTKKKVEDRIAHIDQVFALLFSGSNTESLPALDNSDVNRNVKPLLPIHISSTVSPLAKRFSQPEIQILASGLGIAILVTITMVVIIIKSSPLEDHFVKVETAEELRNALNNSSIYEIQLLDSIFEVDFPIVLSSIRKLVGMGSDKTLIRSNINFTQYTTASNILVANKDCEITGLEFSTGNHNVHSIKFDGVRNTVKDIVLNGVKVLITRGSDYNHLSNLTFTNILQGNVIEVNGNRNKFDSLRFVNYTNSPCSLYISGSGNEFETVISKKTTCSLIIAGGRKNHIKYAEFEEVGEIEVRYGVDHIISNIQGQYNLRLSSTSENIVVRNSTFPSVLVDGNEQHLININVLKDITIKGSKHWIENCNASIWRNRGILISIIGGNCTGKRC